MTDIAWENKTTELINRVEQEIKETQAKLAILQNRKATLQGALLVYREMVNIPLQTSTLILTPEEIKNKSNREILILIAQQNNGLIIGKTAINLMKEMEVFANPENASSIVYTLLNKSKDFVKVGHGIYRLRDRQYSPQGVLPLEQNTPLLFNTNSLKGLSHMAALKLIARHNNGKVRPHDAKPLFVEAGLIKGDPKLVEAHLYTSLKKSKEFKKVSPGTFKLIE